MSNKDKDELISRRLFFKKAAKTAIPLLAGVSVMPYFISCGKDLSIEDAILQRETGCSSYCTSSCSGSSTSSGCASCSTGCISSCGSGCNNGCGSACSNSCSSGCGDSCSNGANNNNDDSVSDATGTISGHEYVDLGLSVKWARCDIQSTILAGNERPEFIGTHHYVTGYGPDENGDNNIITQIASNEHITNSLCGTSLDIAKQEWGSNWRLPSIAEWQELFNNCSTQTIEYHSYRGIKFTSNLNGRSIFISHCWCREINSNEMIFIRFSGIVVMGSKPSLSYVWVIKSNGVSSKVKLLQFPLPIRAVTGNGGGGGGCNNACSNSATNNGCSQCQNDCTGSASASCGTCTAECFRTCSSACDKSCTGACNTTCNLACNEICKNMCHGACTSSCEGSGYTTCGSCLHSCNVSCYGACSTLCKSYCTGMCVQMCSGQCSGLSS